MTNLEVPDGSVDEDCLYLNVTTPRGRTGNPLPVVVWLPGGGFSMDTGSSYGARRMAVDGDVVVVTVNYRLGVFGFFGLPGLEDSGTFGLQDQQAALRWARRNAAAFGGDPHNVTLAGESAGALSACAQLTSPAARGLFDKVVMQSGSCLTNWPANLQYPGQPAGSLWAPRSQVEASGSQMALELGCADPAQTPACLRRRPTSELLEHTMAFIQPAFDTAVLPRDPAQALREGRFHRVPVISGTNHDENRPWVAAFGEVTASAYPRLIKAAFDDQAARVEAEYPLSAYDSPALAWGAVTTDRMWSCTQVDASRLLARQVPTYGYDFAGPAPRGSGVYDPGLPDLGLPLGAAHGMELGYLFDLGGPPVAFTPAQRHLSNQMIAYWTNFAHTGDPNGPGLPHWPLLEAADPAAQGQSLASAKIAPIDLSAEHHCDFWSSLD